MSRISTVARSALRRHILRSAVYEGSGGTAWFAGSEQRAPSIAEFFCGDDTRPGPRGRVLRRRVPDRIAEVAATGGLPILRLHEASPELAGLLQRAITVPALVDIHTELPPDVDALRTQLRTSTTREDFRRIRKANFTYRVTTDRDAVREFHARHYTPLLTTRYPDDGSVRTLEKMLSDLDRGGELVCADLDGEWVAGIFNVREQSSYALKSLGIRDADNAVRQKRVVAALIVRSLERAVELGKPHASLGRSLPFLGKGPVWFKAKWGGILTRGPVTRDLHMFLDLRNPAVRRMLSASPVIHSLNGELATSAWLEPGEQPLKATVRDAGRFPGISQWYVFAEPETLDAGAVELASRERIVPVSVSFGGDQPLWLGDLLPEPLRSY
ncbi:MAG TPA: GNAT family N-acetyltransferase [Acidimicrobiia bacterium]|jgi:hypothetical protein|nr:GNAT family N-acetyltransferase [Acidimicrobiia bacterium]